MRCDYLFQYIINGIKYQIAGVLRSQNSYNAGVWRDYVSETVENQYKFAVPLNRDTEKIFYNLRLIIDNHVLTEPLAWRVTKVNRIAPNGVVRVTMAQDQFEPIKDYIEKDEYNNVIAMWADYYSNGEILPQNPIEPEADIYCEVTTTGKKEIKLNDKYKLFSVNFYRQGEEINYKQGSWSFSFKEKDKSKSDKGIILNDPSVLLDVKHYGDLKSIKENQIKIKYIGGYEYLNWILVVTFTENTKGITSSEEVSIVRL